MPSKPSADDNPQPMSDEAYAELMRRRGVTISKPSTPRIIALSDPAELYVEAEPVEELLERAHDELLVSGGANAERIVEQIATLLDALRAHA